MKRIVTRPLLVVALLFAGCGGCQPETLDPLPPTLEPAQLDFGLVRTGDARVLTATLHNPGDAAQELVGLELSGEGFKVAPAAGQLESAARRAIEVTFAPLLAGAHAAELKVLLKGHEPLTLQLRGEGVASECAVGPGPTVEFGSVSVGAATARTVTISNPTSLPFTIEVPGLSGADAQAFALAEGGVGKHEVPAHGELALPIEFKPTSVTSFSAFLGLSGPAACTPTVLALTGRGVQSELECAPVALEFGIVFPGMQKQQVLTCRNVGPRAVAVRDLQISGTNASLFTTPAQSSTELASGGELKVPITFAPVAGGLAAAKLTFNSSIDSELRTVGLTGYGGGPDIETSGPVAFGAVGVGTFRTRELEIRNVGIQVPGTSEDNLRLEEPGGNGGWRAKLPVLVEDPPGGEFVIETPPFGYTTTGIEAGRLARLNVRFAPTSMGLKGARVLIHSNDPDEPVVEVPITASAELLPPCDVEVLQTAVDFGTVEPGTERVLPLRIRNRSKVAGEDCHLSELQLDRESSAAFELVNGPVATSTLAAGATLDVPVRFRAPAASNLAETGRLSFFTSSPAKPLVSIPLTARSGPNCLVAVPETIDFGTVPTGCGSFEAKVAFVNLCESRSLTVASIDSAAGGSASIQLTQRPASPYSLPPRARLVVTVHYRPDASGGAWSAVEFGVTDGTKTVVPVFGFAEKGALHVERFAAGGEQRDVMLVIDDSVSSGATHFQSGLAQIGEFLRKAQTAGTDYRLAVTSTTVGVNCSPPCLNGQFVNGPDSALGTGDPRILAPALPNSQALLESYVRLSMFGSAIEMPLAAAALAVTEPNASGINAGFRRAGVPLHVVVITDEVDQSRPDPRAYLAQLRSSGAEVVLSGAVPTGIKQDPTCHYGSTPVAPPASYWSGLLNFSEVTGGRIEEFCTIDWAATLTRLGDEVFGPKRSYTLLLEPDTTSRGLEVHVNGTLVPELDAVGSRLWSYEPLSRKLEFTSAGAPAFGATVEAKFVPKCGP